MDQELHPFEQSLSTQRFRITSTWHIKDGKFHITSTCEGPVDLLDFDATAHPEARDELWQKTCFECFLLKTNSTEYEEWNLSPAGNFQRYRFQAYRERNLEAPTPTREEFKLMWEHTPGKMSAEFTVPLPFEPQKLQVCWVLKTKAGEIQYWALNHTLAKPDFHNSDSFEEIL